MGGLYSKAKLDEKHRKNKNLNLREIFFLQILFHQFRMTTYNKIMKQIKEGSLTKKEEYCLSLHEVSTLVHNPHKAMDIKSPLNT